MTEAAQPPKDLIGFLDFYLVQKAPFQLPDNAKEWIVKYGPWIAIVLLILAVPPLLLVLGLGGVLVPFGGAGYAAGFTYVSVILMLEVGLSIEALPGLFARKMSGWTLLVWSQVVSCAVSILPGALIGAILSLSFSLAGDESGYGPFARAVNVFATPLKRHMRENIQHRLR